MKKLILILVVTLFVFSVSFAATGISTTNKDAQAIKVIEAKRAPLPNGPQTYAPAPHRDRAFATVGAGGTSGGGTTITPFSTYWHDGQHQYLFTAAELSAAGLPSGNINGVGWNINSANSATLNGFNIEIKHTTATTVTAFETGFTNVYSGTHVALAGWNDFTFSTPWAWNGTDNVLVMVCFDNSSYTSNSTCYYDNTVAAMTGYAYNDYTAGCTDPYEGNTLSRPQTRFEYTGAAPILGVSPSSKDFGNVCLGACSDWQVFTLSNTGIGTINVASIALGGADAAEFQIQNNPAPCALPPDATVEVRFCPVTAGAKTATLDITDDRAVTNIPLSGTGVYNALQGDFCCNPLVVGPLPYADEGTTTLFTDYGWNASPDVWYEFNVDHDGEYTMSLCRGGTNYDSYIRLIADDCTTQLAYNDDYCGLQSEMNCVALTVGTYYILIEGYSSNSGYYELDVTECFGLGACCDYTDPMNPVCTDDIEEVNCTGANYWWHENILCSTDPCLAPCVECPPEGIPEGEACGLDTNGGCNMAGPPYLFEPIACEDIICGTMWADAGTRDTDWYAIDLTGVGTITMNIESDVPCIIGMVTMTGGWGSIGCPATAFYDYTVIPRCTPGSLEIAVPTPTDPANMYCLWVGPDDYYDSPCGWWSGNDYIFQVNCEMTATQPDPPVVSIVINGNDVDLSWAAVTGATGYNIYRSLDPYSWGAVYDTTTGLTWTDTDGALAGMYYYYVTATN